MAESSGKGPLLGNQKTSMYPQLSKLPVLLSKATHSKCQAPQSENPAPGSGYCWRQPCSLMSQFLTSVPLVTLTWAGVAAAGPPGEQGHRLEEEMGGSGYILLVPLPLANSESTHTLPAAAAAEAASSRPSGILPAPVAIAFPLRLKGNPDAPRLHWGRGTCPAQGEGGRNMAGGWRLVVPSPGWEPGCWYL